MNAYLSRGNIRCVLLCLAGLGCLPLFAASALAAGASPDLADVGFLQANFIFDMVSDRARLIQVSLVIVALGCAVMWWYR